MLLVLGPELQFVTLPKCSPKQALAKSLGFSLFHRFPLFPGLEEEGSTPLVFCFG